MAYLTDKIVKYKKLIKSSTSMILIIPTNWIHEMDWTRQTILKMSWRPGEEKIIINKSDREIDEEVSELVP